jgi:hypothetical protein
VNDQALVILTVALTAGLAAILVLRTVRSERAAGSGSQHTARLTRPGVIRWLDFSGTVVLALLIATIVTRVLNTVL